MYIKKNVFFIIADGVGCGGGILFFSIIVVSSYRCPLLPVESSLPINKSEVNLSVYDFLFLFFFGAAARKFATSFCDLETTKNLTFPLHPAPPPNVLNRFYKIK